MYLRPVAAEIAVAQVVTIDQHHIGALATHVVAPSWSAPPLAAIAGSMPVSAVANAISKRGAAVVRMLTSCEAAGLFALLRETVDVGQHGPEVMAPRQLPCERVPR